MDCSSKQKDARLSNEDRFTASAWLCDHVKRQMLFTSALCVIFPMGFCINTIPMLYDGAFYYILAGVFSYTVGRL